MARTMYAVALVLLVACVAHAHPSYDEEGEEETQAVVNFISTPSSELSPSSNRRYIERAIERVRGSLARMSALVAHARKSKQEKRRHALQKKLDELTLTQHALLRKLGVVLKKDDLLLEEQNAVLRTADEGRSIALSNQAAMQAVDADMVRQHQFLDSESISAAQATQGFATENGTKS